MRTEARTMHKDLRSETDRIGYYFQKEKWVLLVVAVTGILYNVGLVAGPWFEGQMVQCLCDILGMKKEPAEMILLAAAYALTILGLSLVALWGCRRELSNLYLGTYVKVFVVVYILLLALVAAAARKAGKDGGKLGKLQVLPSDADILPIYVACGLSAVAMASALVSITVAYYAMWILAMVVFALAVYYTVKQL